MGKRPNIILIITDQHHHGAVSALGNEFIDTPAIDTLFNRGKAFKKAYCTMPICTPSRASIYTGKMPSEVGVIHNRMGIPKEIPNIGQWLRKNSGYETIYAGKWHVPEMSTFDIPGFKVLTGGNGYQGDYGDIVTAISAQNYILNRKEDRPFFMAVNFVQPHDICQWIRLHKAGVDTLPYKEIEKELFDLPSNFAYDFEEPMEVVDERRNKPPYINTWKEKDWQYYRWSYMRHVEMVDGAVQSILDALEVKNMIEDTMIIFTSDHGENMGSHKMVQKLSPYEQAIKVPLVISYPGRVQEGTIDETHLISGVDIFPTICKYAGIDSLDVTGFSMDKILEDIPTNWRESLKVEMLDNKGVVTINNKYKHIQYNGGNELLFDRKHDMEERINLMK